MASKQAALYNGLVNEAVLQKVKVVSKQAVKKVGVTVYIKEVLQTVIKASKQAELQKVKVASKQAVTNAGMMATINSVTDRGCDV